MDRAAPPCRDGAPLPRQLWPRRRAHTWLVRWFTTEADGRFRRHSRNCATRAQADAFRAATEVELRDGPSARRSPEKMTIHQFSRVFESLGVGPRGQRLRPASLQEAMASLRRFENKIGPSTLLIEVTKADAVEYVAGLRNSGDRVLSASTVNKHKVHPVFPGNTCLDHCTIRPNVGGQRRNPCNLKHLQASGRGEHAPKSPGKRGDFQPECGIDRPAAMGHGEWSSGTLVCHSLRCSLRPRKYRMNQT